MTTTITETERQELRLLESKNRTYRFILASYGDVNTFSAIIMANKIEVNEQRINELNSK